MDLTGDDYNRDTYQPKRPKSDNRGKGNAKSKSKGKGKGKASSSSSSASSESDTDGEKPKATQEYYLGYHCKKRSYLYHQMTHWG